MIESNIQCPSCTKSINQRYHTYWKCDYCGEKYQCINGIPNLYVEKTLKKEDINLRDGVYNTFLGWFYNYWNPFIMTPVRPIKVSLVYWLVYFLLVFLFGFLLYQIIEWLAFRGLNNTTVVDILSLISFILYTYFLFKYPLYAYLLLITIPVKISLSIKKFKPKISHLNVHSEFQTEFLNSTNKLKMLDVATGSSNSLYRHGWMKLNADYTAVDLSKNMIIQGMNLMSKKGVPADFIICDATKLPFESETFDIVTNYGAINGFSDPKSALTEMVRVTKKGGKILFLDEQEYETSSWLEHLYFKHILTYNNTIVGCPTHLLPKELEDIEVHQVYEFVYICTARKK